MKVYGYSMDKVRVIAPAKLNLSLDITGVDEKGYHLMDMIMQAVSVFERVTLSKRDEGITLSSNARYIPTDERNLAYKAALAFFSHTGIKGGADIYIKKKVPIKAGMGGGSADRAAVLVGLDRLYETGLSVKELCRLGAGVGSDVPFMIVGGTRRVGGVGDVIKPCPPLPPCRLVICMPYKGVSTPAAFAKYDEMGEKTRVDTDGLVAAIKNRDIEKAALLMANDLEKAADLPDIFTIKDFLKENGAVNAVMTGSGRAVFGVFTDEEKAQKARRSAKGICRSVFLAGPVPFGRKVESRE